MSYTTRVSGQFTPEPPLLWGEILGTPFTTVTSTGMSAKDIDLVLLLDEKTHHTATGTLIERTGTAVVMQEISEYNSRNLLNHVQRVVDMFPGHDWTGRLNCEGEEAGDLWRVIIRDDRALEVKPKIVWPEDD